MSFNIEVYNRIDCVKYDRDDKTIKKLLNKMCSEYTIEELEATLNDAIEKHKDAPLYRPDGHSYIKEDYCSIYALSKLAIEQKKETN